jgi:hypothetical protein
MTQLEKLYQSIQTLNELGATLPQSLIEQTNRIEEEIIKNDVIPALAETINPVIQQIQRDIMLIVDYKPNEPLSVRIAKKKSSVIPQEQDFPQNDEKEEKIIERTFAPKSPKTGLIVEFPDGKVIAERYAYETLIEALKKIGWERVRDMNIIVNKLPFISNKEYDVDQHEIIKGVYCVTHSATKRKKEILDQISEQYNLGLKVEIVD